MPIVMCLMNVLLLLYTLSTGWMAVTHPILHHTHIVSIDIPKLLLLLGPMSHQIIIETHIGTIPMVSEIP